MDNIYIHLQILYYTLGLYLLWHHISTLLYSLYCNYCKFDYYLLQQLLLFSPLFTIHDSSFKGPYALTAYSVLAWLAGLA